MHPLKAYCNRSAKTITSANTISILDIAVTPFCGVTRYLPRPLHKQVKTPFATHTAVE
ncbi:hypothetical protein [Helicobacter heilmannii]|uniref:hypothetical protein n=1 Tax=Helicobacter heilmannii TaxID=35817 RepID=UPI0012E178B8|nr:hypothetical protein [Helicobacter heilmannii]